MRSAFFLVILAFFVPVAAPAAMPPSRATPAPASSPANRLAALAPADKYFGPFGMSPLSIRSTIGLLGRQYHYRTISDRDLLRKALVTEDALRRWREQYPADTWLAPTFFHLEQLYQAVQTDKARKHATAILQDVIRNYPSTNEGHLSRSRLAAGFPPLIPETPLVVTPTAVPSPSPENASDVSPTPGPSGAAVPSAASTAPAPVAPVTPSATLGASPQPRSSPK